MNYRFRWRRLKAVITHGNTEPMELGLPLLRWMPVSVMLLQRDSDVVLGNPRLFGALLAVASGLSLWGLATRSRTFRMTGAAIGFGMLTWMAMLFGIADFDGLHWIQYAGSAIVAAWVYIRVGCGSTVSGLRWVRRLHSVDRVAGPAECM